MIKDHYAPNDLRQNPAPGCGRQEAAACVPARGDQTESVLHTKMVSAPQQEQISFMEALSVRDIAFKSVIDHGIT